jgi:hypothetical protein
VCAINIGYTYSPGGETTVRDILEQAKRLGTTVEENLDRMADLYDLMINISREHELFEEALIPTVLHDTLLKKLREEIDEQTEKIEWQSQPISVAI